MSELVSLHGVGKRFGKRFILQGLSLSIREGEAYLVMGANGAGKSTLFRLIVGLYRLHAGEILFRGRARRPGGPCPVRLGGFIEEPGFFPELTGLEHLREASRVSGHRWDRAHAEKVAADFGLGLSELGARVCRYSSGMRKRLAISRAVADDPELLILDEPTNGLDPLGVRELREAMVIARRSYGATILFSSHVLAEAKSSATRAGVLHHGSIRNEVDLEGGKDDLEEVFLASLAEAEG
jgi:ABC-type multidrug transport system ATPase subunit